MAKELNLVVDQGADFSTNVIAYTNSTSAIPIDMSTYSVGYGQIRRSHSSQTITANLDIDLYQSNSAGIVGFSMGDATTAGISSGRYVYDVVVAGQSDESNTVINYAPSAISNFDSPPSQYKLLASNNASNTSAPNYISVANDVLISITTEKSYVGGASLKINIANFSNEVYSEHREVVFANAHWWSTGNTTETFAGAGQSSYPTMQEYGDNAVELPLSLASFTNYGIPIPDGKRWILSVFAHSNVLDGYTSETQLHAYSSNSTHTPYLNAGTGALIRYSGADDGILVYNYGEWARLVLIIDLRTDGVDHTNLPAGTRLNGGGSNTHTYLIPSIETKVGQTLHDFISWGSNSSRVLYLDGMMLEEQPNTSIITPSPYSSLSGVTGDARVIRLREGTVTVTPRVTKV
jgi:hypothetical protein